MLLNNFSHTMNELIDKVAETDKGATVHVRYYNESGTVEWDVSVEAFNLDEHLATFSDKSLAVNTADEMAGLLDEMGLLEGYEIE